MPKPCGTGKSLTAYWIAEALEAKTIVVAVPSLALVRQSLTDLLAFYKGHEKEAKELITVGESKPDGGLPADQLAAWTMLANQLLNLDEVLNK